MAEPLHVSGIVVHARPEASEAVRAAILALPGTEIAAVGHGKLVVVLEAADEGAMSAVVHRIALMPDVYTAALAYHEILDEPEAGERPCG